MDDKVRVFISYKREFGEAAREIAKILRSRGGRGIEVFLAAELAAGTDWFREIKKQLASSKLLLLLFTDPSKEWDWCLYEAGLFTDLRDTSRSRIVCLHRTDAGRPDPLKHLQAVKADVASVKEFLKELFGKTTLTEQSEPLNTEFASDEASVANDAARICSLFNPSTKHQWHYYTKYFELGIKDLATMRDGKIPDEATVMTKNQETFKLFGLIERDDGWKWGDFKNAVRQACDDDRWIDELADAAHAASRTRDIPQIQATFTATDGNIYHPILARSDTYPPGTMTFEILLMETVTGGLLQVPPNLGILITGLRAGLRLRYEVLTHLELLEDSRGDEQHKHCDRIARAMRNIDIEVRSRGVKATSQGPQIERDNFVSAFVDPNERRLAGNLYDRLRSKRKELRSELEAIEVEKVKFRLRELEHLSGQLMVLASKRYYELICELVGPDRPETTTNQLRSVG